MTQVVTHTKVYSSAISPVTGTHWNESHTITGSPIPTFTIDPLLAITTNDATPALQAAYTAAVAAGGGIILIPPGTYHCRTAQAQGAAVTIVPFHTGMVWFCGSGTQATVIKTESGCRTFLGALAGGPGTIYQYLRVSDMTIDGGSFMTPGVTFNFGLIYHHGVRASINKFYFQRIDAINVSASSGSLQGRYCLNFTCLLNGTTGQGVGEDYTMENIVVEDFDFGRGRTGGGVVGIIVQHYTSAATIPIALTSLANRNQAGWGDTVGWLSDGKIGNVNIRRGKWDSGISSLTSFVGVGVMIGQHGHQKRDTLWHIEDVTCIASPDDCFEFNSALNLQIDNCTADSSVQENWYFSNTGGMPIPEEQSIRINGCRSVDTYFTGIVLYTDAIRGEGFGSIALNDFTVTELRAGLTVNTSGVARLAFCGNVREIAIRNLNIAMKGSATGIANNDFISYGANLLFSLQAGRTKISVDGVRMRFEPHIDDGGFSGIIFNQTGVITVGCANAQLDIKNVQASFDCIKTGTVSARSALLQLPQSSSTGTTGNRQQESFASDVKTKSFIDESGNYADLTITGGVLTCTANVTDEHRILWAMWNAGVVNKSVGPFVDSALWVKATPGATTLSFKAGLMLKRTELDPTSYLDCYVDDDGAGQTRVRIDEVLAGVRTNLANTNSATAIANGVSFYVKATIQGNVVTCTYLSTTPSDAVSGGTVIDTATYTLASAARTLTFGRSALGWGGITWIPQGTDATLDDLNRGATSVLSGGYKNLTIRATPNMAVLAVIVFPTPTLASSWCRVESRWLDFDGIQFADVTGVGTVTPITASVDTTMLSKLRRKNCDWVTAPVSAAITPGASAYTYTNQDGYAEDVAIYAGTVSDISLSRDGGTSFGVIQDTTGATVRVEPGEQVKVTYSSVPTMIKHPVL